VEGLPDLGVVVQHWNNLMPPKAKIVHVDAKKKKIL
jgi:hypothetical protein